MRAKDADERVYECEPLEEVTITLKPSDPTNFTAVYSFGSQPARPVVGNQVKFTMHGNKIELWMTFSFLSPTGKCKVELDGAGSSHFDDPNQYVNIGMPLMNCWTFEV